MKHPANYTFVGQATGPRPSQQRVAGGTQRTGTRSELNGTTCAATRWLGNLREASKKRGWATTTNSTVTTNSMTRNDPGMEVEVSAKVKHFESENAPNRADTFKNNETEPLDKTTGKYGAHIWVYQEDQQSA